MKSDESPIIDYYPKDFYVDLKGKRFAWLGEVILPFIDEDRLVDASSNFDRMLDKHEKFRNRLGCNLLFCRKEFEV